MEDKFRLLDVAYCFLTRHRAALSVKNVVRMADSLSPGAVTVADLRAMAAMAPTLLQLHTAEQDQLLHRDDMFRDHTLTSEELELVSFPSVPQTSQRASDKRKKLFAELLQRAGGEEAAVARVAQVETEALEAAKALALEAERSVAASSIPGDVGSASPWVDMLRSLDIYEGQIVHIEYRAAREAQCKRLDRLNLPPQVVAALGKRGIDQLYSHQYDSIEGSLSGDNVALATSTASGKSLAFIVPTLVSLVEDPRSTFLYLFPTKALAQDQLKSLRSFLTSADLPESLCTTFDGDTPMIERTKSIRDSQIFLTNPDIMHRSILPKHTQWKGVLSKLKLLVVDEAHMYRGVFGSHVACVFRRLFRLCGVYGANPRVICCSATIRNPEAHFRMLFPTLPSIKQSLVTPPNFEFFVERQLRVITQDGAPTGKKTFCVWNPLVHKYSTQPSSVDNASTVMMPPTKRKRKRESSAEYAAKVDVDINEQANKPSTSTSSIFQSASIFSRLVEANIHTLLFCKGRKLSELVLMSVHSVLKASEHTRDLIQRVHTYRGGYTVADRRHIESRLFHGDLVGVIATNALELGIDIGELDCTMHLGLPTSVASLWQQAGRAGRKHTQQSLAIIVCFDAPLDQHFARHACELFTLQPEAVSLNPTNSKILSAHLVCAAHEHALFDSRSGLNYIDEFVFGSVNGALHDEGSSASMSELLDAAVRKQHLFKQSNADGGGYRIHSCAPKELRTLNLRSISELVYKVVVDDGYQQVLDVIPGEMVFFQVYPTAVYLHQAQEYIITRLDVDQKIAFARRAAHTLTYFTTSRDITEVDIVKIERRVKQSCVPDRPVWIGEGQVSVSTMVFGSTLLEKKTMRVLHVNDFSLPPMQSFGNAIWLEVTHELRDEVEAASFVWAGAIHGVGHLLLAVIPLFVLCDAGDINSEHYNPFEQRVRPNRITIYERREGGSGVVDEIVRVLPEIVRKAWSIARECACVSGCPSCIHLSQCTEYNKVLDKRGSLMVLDYLARAFGAE